MSRPIPQRLLKGYPPRKRTTRRAPYRVGDRFWSCAWCGARAGTIAEIDHLSDCLAVRGSQAEEYSRWEKVAHKLGPAIRRTHTLKWLAPRVRPQNDRDPPGAPA